MYVLANPVRPYAWGSTTAIAELLGRAPSGEPEAELWLGAHPGSPSIAHTGAGQVALDALIAAHPRQLLGDDTRSAFGDRLPFLAKLLAAARPLSLQVHPTPAQAQKGFAAEEARGVPRDADTRNYRDCFHKPEMILALGRFEALCGFREPAEAARLFRLVAHALSATNRPVPRLLSEVMQCLESAAGTGTATPQAVLRQVLGALLDGGAEVSNLVAQSALALTDAFPSDVSGDLHAALRSVVELHAAYPGDPGVLVTLLLNRISLDAGEAISLPPGCVHAYLSGFGVEVMASSDNVLRGGLTTKHIDVPELLATVDFTPAPVPRVPSRITGLGQQVWEPPFREFSLQRVELAAGSEPVPLRQHGPAIVLAVAGAALLDSPKGETRLARGESVFIGAAEEPVLVHPAHDGGPTVLFAVTCGAPVDEDDAGSGEPVGEARGNA